MHYSDSFTSGRLPLFDGELFADLEPAAALTAEDSTAVDITYGAEEAAVIEANRTRIGEIEAALQAAGIVA